MTTRRQGYHAPRTPEDDLRAFADGIAGSATEAPPDWPVLIGLHDEVVCAERLAGKALGSPS